MIRVLFICHGNICRLPMAEFMFKDMVEKCGLSWWNYRVEAELLSENYHVILSVIDGHADSGEKFESIEAAAEMRAAYKVGLEIDLTRNS